MTSLLDKIFGLPIDPTTRKIMVVYIDVTNSNPNGDPDQNGAPRGLPPLTISEFDDLDTMDVPGMISSQCLKRLVRDYAALHGAKLFFERGIDLGKLQQSFMPEEAGGNKDKVSPEQCRGIVNTLRRTFWDLPLFGGVLTQFGHRAIGACQISSGFSVDPVHIDVIGGTRTCGFEKKTGDKSGAADGEDTAGEEEGTPREGPQGANMFKYKQVRYGLYRVEIQYNPHRVNNADGNMAEALALLYEGLIRGPEISRSAHRTGVNVRSVVVFDAPTSRGTGEPESVTLDRVRAVRVAGESGKSAEKASDYDIQVDDTDLPAGTNVHTWAAARKKPWSGRSV